MKSGLDYVPLEVDIDYKLELVESEFGLKGFAVVIKLYQYILKHGYFVKWDIDVCRLFAKRYCAQASWQLVSEIVNCALKRDIFDLSKYHDHGILTSMFIQESYFKATRRRTAVEVNTNYLLFIADQFIKNVDTSSSPAYIFVENENIAEISQVNSIDDNTCTNLTTCARTCEEWLAFLEEHCNGDLLRDVCERSFSDESIVDEIFAAVSARLAIVSDIILGGKLYRYATIVAAAERATFGVFADMITFMYVDNTSNGAVKKFARKRISSLENYVIQCLLRASQKNN